MSGRIGSGKHKYEINVSWLDPETSRRWSTNIDFYSEEALSHHNHTAVYAEWERLFIEAHPTAQDINMSDPVSYAGYR